MDKEVLRMLIQQKEKEYSRAKLKRFVLVILFYSALICALGFWREFEGFNLFSVDGLLTLVDTFLPSIFIAVPFVIFSAIIFDQLQRYGASEDAVIENLKQQLEEVEKNEEY